MAGIKILIVEDDWIIAKEISLSLNDLGFEVVGVIEAGEDVLKKLPELNPDIILLDIGLSGEMNGIDTAKLIKQQTKVPFIFLTALADTSTIEKAKLTEPYAYLVKPTRPETLYSTIEITLHNAAQRKDPTPPLKEGLTIEDSIFVKTKNRLEKIHLKEILWVEASDIYALVCTVSGKFLLNTSLKVVEEKFPQNKFIRSHRSYIVNIDKIEAIEEDELIIIDQRIPIGKTYKEKLMSKLSFL